MSLGQLKSDDNSTLQTKYVELLQKTRKLIYSSSDSVTWQMRKD